MIWTFSHMIKYRVSLQWTWRAWWRELFIIVSLLFSLLKETWNVMKTFFVESVKFSCISLAEKLHVTFDGTKGISRPSFCFIKNTEIFWTRFLLAADSQSPISALWRSFFSKIICSKTKRQVFFFLLMERLTSRLFSKIQFLHLHVQRCWSSAVLF